MSEDRLVIRVGDKDIEINEETLKILRKYKRTEMTLEQLAASLSLEGWEEAYELVKKIPLWVMDIEPTMWSTIFKKHASEAKKKS
ncbi:MAG: hypothetical protein QXO93_00225 [Acidilobaceae archaeon]